VGREEKAGASDTGDGEGERGGEDEKRKEGRGIERVR
jgi:hypothetical protein